MQTASAFIESPLLRLAAGPDQCEHFVAGAHGVVVDLAGRAFLVVVLAVVVGEDAVPRAMLVVDEMLPRIGPYPLVPLVILPQPRTRVQQSRGGQRFGLHPEVLVRVADAAVGREAVVDAAVFRVPGAHQRG